MKYDKKMGSVKKMETAYNKTKKDATSAARQIPTPVTNVAKMVDKSAC